jgi:hypothetical protein
MSSVDECVLRSCSAVPRLFQHRLVPADMTPGGHHRDGHPAPGTANGFGPLRPATGRLSPSAAARARHLGSEADAKHFLERVIGFVALESRSGARRK